MSVDDDPARATGSDQGRGATRLRVVHRTVTEYDGSVRSSFNEVRMTPLTIAGQFALESRVEVTPRVAAYRYVDYFGAQVVAFDTQVPHSRLEIVATSLVEVDQVPPVRTVHATWDYVNAPHRRDRNAEWLLDGPMTAPDPELERAARDLAGRVGPQVTAFAICDLVRQRMTYLPGSTGVTTTAVEAWQAGTGVCQDFAHVVIGAIRAVGIPARYVSGYLHPHPEAPLGQPVEGQSHAWVEWWVGEWEAFDPTNGAPVGSDHVVVARGRDYTDVPPLRGVYSGPRTSRLTVTVEVTRLR